MISRIGVNRRARTARRAVSLGAAALALLAAGCQLDVTNPNAAGEAEVLSTPAGLRALAVGLQGRFGNALEHAVWVPGVVSGELGNTDASLSTSREFQRYPTASANTPRIETNNLELLNFWARQYAVVKAAQDLLDNVDDVTLQPGTRGGISALARTLQAISYGTLIEAWQTIPLDPTAAQPTYSDRATVLARTLELLAAARADLAAAPVTPEFTALLAPGLDLLNTTRAAQARYSLAAGQYAQALAFANEVPAAATSEFRFSTVDPNPLWQAFAQNRYFSAIASFRTNAEAGDTRVNRFTTATVTTPFGGAQVVPINVYRNQNDPVPLFTQDELTLIRAEALARLNRVAEAATEVNRVRTANGLAARGAAALATQAAVLDEIYRQRTYSLFLTGQRWADQRRFGRIAEARTEWLPYPAQETVGNPNAPQSP
jgi:hypothetical protein